MAGRAIFSVALLVVVGVCLAAAVLGLAVHFTPPKSLPGQDDGPRPGQQVIVVGAGLTAAACLKRLQGPWARVTSVCEASGGFGGRALSVPSPAAKPSTAEAPNDLGAWCFQPLLHGSVLRFLGDLGVPYVDVTLVSAKYSFLFDGATKTRRPWGVLPPIGAVAWEVPYSTVPAREALLWFGHTGLWRDAVDGAGDAALDVVAAWDAPSYASAPAGFGWQDVVARGLGVATVVYDCALAGIQSATDTATTNADTTPTLRLLYADGRTDTATAVLLTLPPPALAKVQGVLPHVASAIQESFVTVPSGVVYATWNSVDVWWPAAGWPAGMVASSTALGRMVPTGPNQIRLAVSGAGDVQFWNDVFVRQGTAAALRTLGTLLREVFPSATDPATATFKPWPTGTHLWRAGVDREAVRALLWRPCGVDQPVWWASADTAAQWPSWVEGAVTQGYALADAVMGPPT